MMSNQCFKMRSRNNKFENCILLGVEDSQEQTREEEEEEEEEDLKPPPPGTSIKTELSRTTRKANSRGASLVEDDTGLKKKNFIYISLQTDYRLYY